MKRRRGLSLIETIASVAIISFGVAVVIASVPFAMRTWTWSRQTMVASNLAQRQLSAIVSRGFVATTPTALAANSPKPALLDSATPVATNTYSFTNVTMGTGVSVANSLPNGTGRVAIENLSGDFRRVTVTISWTGTSGTQNYSCGVVVANM